MHRLRAHYEETLRRLPEHEILVLFDIDGTILDLRHMILHVLERYDREHDTDHFEGLRLEEVTVHENQIEALPRLERLDDGERERVQEWYLRHRGRRSGSTPVASRPSGRRRSSCSTRWARNGRWSSLPISCS